MCDRGMLPLKLLEVRSLPRAAPRGAAHAAQTPQALRPALVCAWPLIAAARSRGARGARLARCAGSASGSSPLNLKPKPKEAVDDSGAWTLPSVDKDVTEFYAGRAHNYAWVQTSDTLYLFTPMPEQRDEDAPNVRLDLQQEGSIIRLTVEGRQVLNGRLAHQIKPGEQIWMVEDAADGRPFVVCELDKLTLGLNWASVMEPQVEATADYSKAVVEVPEILSQEEESLVAETLEHLRKTHRSLEPVEGRGAAVGDVLTVDMQGYEMLPKGRGKALDIGTAKGLELELGAGSFPKKVEAGLEGILAGETRDLEVTLGQRAGGLGGMPVICAVTCHELKEQQLPELSDDFARLVKRQDLFKQAGTAEGISEDEAELEDFTLEALKREISTEVRQAAEVQSDGNVEAQLRAHLNRAVRVSCDWAELDDLAEEEQAVRAKFVAEREGLLALIDMDAVDRKAWDKLGEPDDGETLKQVGKDPAREYQDAHRGVFRERVMDEVLQWLRQRMELVEADEGQ